MQVLLFTLKMHDLLLFFFIFFTNFYTPSLLIAHMMYIQEMKSIGAEVNWGVRLTSSKDVGFVFCIIYCCIKEFLWGIIIWWVLVVLNLFFPESRLPVKTIQGGFFTFAWMWYAGSHYYLEGTVGSLFFLQILSSSIRKMAMRVC